MQRPSPPTRPIACCYRHACRNQGRKDGDAYCDVAAQFTASASADAHNHTSRAAITMFAGTRRA